MIPLPDGRHATRTVGRNAGLVFNKFVGPWPADATEGLGDQKATWLEHFRGRLEVSTAPAARLKAMAENNGGKAEIYQSTGPFVTGMGLPNAVENGFLWHHTLGCPYLPGSSVKGMVRAWAEHWLEVNPKIIARLFGGDRINPSAGSLIFYDALPVGAVTLYTEMITPHTGDWRISEKPQNSPPADWISPTPIPFLAVNAGAKFQFAISPRHTAAKGDVVTAFDWLKEALDWIGAGAKTAIGFGRFLSQEDIQRNLWEEERFEGELAAAQRETVKNAPPSVGDRAVHDEWGVVEVRMVNGDIAHVYSIDEGEDTSLPLAELRKQ